MLSPIINNILFVLTFVGFAGIVSAFNAFKSVQWKRAEIAGLYLREFYADPEVAFACRCLEWSWGKLVVPDCLQPLLQSDQKLIDHDFNTLVLSMTTVINKHQFDQKPNMQIYRTAFDTFFTKMSMIASAIDNKLFGAKDIEEIGYWVVRIEKIGAFENFIEGYGYRKSTNLLRKEFRKSFEDYGKIVMNVRHSESLKP